MAIAVTFCTVVIHALAMMPIVYFVHYELRVGRAGVRFSKDVVIVAGAVLVALCVHLAAIATWALVLNLCGEFSQLAEAVYHSGLNYTTLGDSDAVMSPGWKLLVPLEGANGMLMFGISTATLFAVIQRLIQTRLSQPSSYDRRFNPNVNKRAKN
ncbi:MAG TPA: ion channel [Candidatus Udaeobacter sp.]|nr:ion channel [Candidatus Udaeobacter sp.]